MRTVNSRDWIKTWAAAPLPLMAAAGTPAGLEVEIYRLKLRHTWTTTMSSSDYRDEIQLRFTRDGITGHGEGAPIVRYNEDAEHNRAAVESVRAYLAASDPGQFTKIMQEVSRKVEGNYAAKAAIDIALLDWSTQRMGIPLCRYFGLD